MKKLTFAVISIFLLASIYSCKEHPNKKYIGKIDTLITQVSQAERKLKEINVSEIDKIIDETKADFKALENKMDTIEKPVAFIMSDYFSAQRSLGKMKEKYEEAIKDVAYSKKQLETLKHDVDYNKLNEKAIQEYYNTEAEAVSRLMETSVNIELWANSALSRRNKLKPQIDSLMNIYK